MLSSSQHKFNDNGKCEKCGLTEEYIADNKSFICKGKTKVAVNLIKKTKNKKYI